MTNSVLTLSRPDIWTRAVSLATRLTGYTYAPKMPLQDGTIYACGGYPPGHEYYTPPRPPKPVPQPTPAPELPTEPNPDVHPVTPSGPERDWKDELESHKRRVEEIRRRHGDEAAYRYLMELLFGDTANKEIDYHRSVYGTPDTEAINNRLWQLERTLEYRWRKNRQNTSCDPRRSPDAQPNEEAPMDEDERRRRRHGLFSAPRVFVPEGAMEWLLHEVGHWLAASPEERLLDNYGLSAAEHGHDGEREWQAWAFEEIVLAPFGHARGFAPLTQRDGAAFAKSGPMPAWSLWHIEKRITEARVDVEPWRSLYGEWIRFEQGLSAPSWERSN